MKTIIALLALTLSVSAMAADYSCGGTEPFWDLEIQGNTLTFNKMMDEGTAKPEEILSRVNAHGTGHEFAFVVKTEKSTATIITGECSDGMSDNVYTNHIMLTTGDQVLYGCCNQLK